MNDYVTTTDIGGVLMMKILGNVVFGYGDKIISVNMLDSLGPSINNEVGHGLGSLVDFNELLRFPSTNLLIASLN